MTTETQPFWRRFLRALTHSGPGYDLTPLPRRGDHVEAWLKAQRDQYSEHHDAQWDLIDGLLDEYRLHADTATPLDQHCCEAGTPDDCYGCYREREARR